jgi:DNA-binding FadR family transcriptional regulator
VKRKVSAAKSSPRKSVKTAKNPAATSRSTGRIHGRITEELGVAIISGRHPPGSVLLNEIEASEKLGISRPVYREAMRILAAKGLVQSRPKTGTRVLPRSTWNLLDPDVLAWMFQGEPDPEFVRQLFELRGIIEPAAAAFAAERRTSSQLSRLGHALEEMARHGLHTVEGRAADEAFHAEILTATGNETLMALINSVSASVRWTTIFKVRGGRTVRDSIPDHRKLYSAIAEGNADEARIAAQDLLSLALEDTKLIMKKAGRAPRTGKAAAA